MIEYMYTKIFGIIVGILTIFIGIGFGLLAFIGMSLSNALNTGYEYSFGGRPLILMLTILLVFDFFIMVAAFKLKNKVWSVIFIGFCILLCLGFVISFLISFGSLGFKNELFYLCIGIIYLGLGCLAIRKH